MAKITLDVPDDVAEELKALEARLKRLEADKIGVEDAIPEDDIDVVTMGIALSLKRRSLQCLDVDAALERFVPAGAQPARGSAHYWVRRRLVRRRAMATKDSRSWSPSAAEK